MKVIREEDKIYLKWPIFIGDSVKCLGLSCIIYLYFTLVIAKTQNEHAIRRSFVKFKMVKVYDGSEAMKANGIYNTVATK